MSQHCKHSLTSCICSCYFTAIFVSTTSIITGSAYTRCWVDLVGVASCWSCTTDKQRQDSVHICIVVRTCLYCKGFRYQCTSWVWLEGNHVLLVSTSGETGSYCDAIQTTGALCCQQWIDCGHCAVPKPYVWAVNWQSGHGLGCGGWSKHYRHWWW